MSMHDHFLLKMIILVNILQMIYILLKILFLLWSDYEYYVPDISPISVNNLEK